ncbi:KaiC protein [Palleronia pelagia]|uniref:KaiC protein n=1 Tax=Palleronia pelagia TaxID=387096 RepID=A0A1H8MH37_9RHOB|nr:KaiC protein [Palleronia pelagia]
MSSVDLLGTGVPGLDCILFGGLPKRGIYLATGEPGTGKTTLGLQFCLRASTQKQTAMFLTISQDARDLERIAASH